MTFNFLIISINSVNNNTVVRVKIVVGVSLALSRIGDVTEYTKY